MDLKKLSDSKIKKMFQDGKITIADIVDAGICTTCFDKENDYVLYGDNRNRMLYQDDDFDVFLVGNPRAIGHTVVSSKVHYKDMMVIDDDLCARIYVLAKKVMNVLKEVYGAESIYLCTMCDGPMNHFHIQLIPRYSFEKRGSKNFVKERIEYVEDKDKIQELRDKLNYKPDNK